MKKKVEPKRLERDRNMKSNRSNLLSAIMVDVRKAFLPTVRSSVRRLVHPSTDPQIHPPIHPSTTHPRTHPSIHSSSPKWCRYLFYQVIHTEITSRFAPKTSPHPKSFRLYFHHCSFRPHTIVVSPPIPFPHKMFPPSRFSPSRFAPNFEALPGGYLFPRKNALVPLFPKNKILIFYVPCSPKLSVFPCSPYF